MKKTLIIKSMIVAATLAFVTGCASNGGDFKTKFQESAKTFGSAAGDFAGKAVGVAKTVGGGLVPGDYVSGYYVSEEKLAQVEVGMSQAEVEALIGPAPDIVPSDSGDVWKFPYARIPHFGENVNETTLIRFDSNQEVVKAYKVNGGGAAASGNPLLQAAEAQGQL